MIAKRSPAGPTFIGSTRLSMADMVTAASMALPPFFRMSRPACAARGWLVATIPLRAITSDRRCAAHPSLRSPGTAAHQAGAGLASHDFTGDCATMRDAPVTAATIATAMRNLNDGLVLLVMLPLLLSGAL